MSHTVCDIQISPPITYDLLGMKLHIKDPKFEALSVNYGQKIHKPGISWSVICGQKIHMIVGKGGWIYREVGMFGKNNFGFFVHR